MLLIGNSQLGLSEYRCDIAAALEELAVSQEGGGALLVDRAQVMGVDCGGLWGQGTGFGTPRERASSGDYDLVVLVPAIYEPYSGSLTCFDNFRGLAEGAGARFAVMASAQIQGQYPAGFTHMHDGIGDYARARGLWFIPAGDSWVRALGAGASAAMTGELYSPDRSHPGVEGSFLYVLSLWAAIRQASVVGLPRDLAALRCDPAASCLSLAELEACAASSSCGSANGVQRDANDQVSVVSVDDAQAYQAAVDAARAAL